MFIQFCLTEKYIGKVKRRKIRKSYKRSWKNDKKIKVMDMCCGKGGDLLKWKQANVDYVIFVDLAEKSVEECKKRYHHMQLQKSNRLFDAEFIVHDCTKVIYKHIFKNLLIFFKKIFFF